jgi:hypothetical protein
MDHPTGKKPKKVILIGLGPSKSEYMNIMASDSLGINHDEVWGINGAGNVIKVDCSFAMDDYLICPDRTPTFAKFFEEADHPVFTSTPRTPNAIAYPLQDVLNMPGARPYFNGSVSYVAAYAALIGVEELTIFGCDYIYGGMGTKHPRQTETIARYLACMTYWLGHCEAKGMNVIVCPASPLLDADLTVLEQFYGYLIKPIVQKTKPKIKPPPHLGGSFGRCHIDQGALQSLNKEYGLHSFIDIGCGTGGMVEVAHDSGMEAFGIDGDSTIVRRAPILIHDFTTGPAAFDKKIDLAWSVEFLEHVEEQHISHYMAAFKQCNYAVVTFALPGTDGHHHVNCQDQHYWVQKFLEYGFALEEKETKGVRKASTMGRNFMRDNGLVFRNTNNGF